MEYNDENYYDLRNNNDENINVLIEYLNNIHPKYMKGSTEVRYNYNPEPEDNKAVERFAKYGIHLENLSFDKIMNDTVDHTIFQNINFVSVENIQEVLDIVNIN